VPLPELLSVDELAEYLGVTRAVIYQNRHRGGDLPPAIKVGRHLRFRLDVVQAWLDAKEVAA
jgi:excisionase family DNA binding protein